MAVKILRDASTTSMDHGRTAYGLDGKHGRGAAFIRGNLAEGITVKFNRDVEEVKEVLRCLLDRAAFIRAIRVIR